MSSERRRSVRALAAAMKRASYPAFVTALHCLAGACSLTGERSGDSAARAAPPRPSGWRGDGSGNFPGVLPCTEWDIDEGKKIIWKAELWNRYTSQVIACNRVFVTSEEELLLCVDRAIGEIKW